MYMLYISECVHGCALCVCVCARSRVCVRAHVSMLVPEVNLWCLPWLLPILFSEITVSHWTWSPSSWLDCQSIERAVLYSVHLPSLEFKCMPLCTLQRWSPGFMLCRLSHLSSLTFHLLFEMICFVIPNIIVLFIFIWNCTLFLFWCMFVF